MKLARIMLSMLLFVITFFIVSAAEYATFRLVIAPGGDTVEVDRVHLYGDEDHPEYISYEDAFDFWGDNLSVGIKADYFKIRGWFDWWPDWQKGMKWADSVYTFTTEIFQSIFMPVSQIKEMKTYYGKTFTFLSAAEQVGLTELEIVALVEQYAADFLIMPSDDLPLTSEQDIKNNYVRHAVRFGMEALNDYSLEGYKYVYNILVKIDKYNTIDAKTGRPLFEEYMLKFLNSETDPDTLEIIYTDIKGTATFLFYQIFLALILSAYFVYQSPIRIRRNADNENEVEGRIFPRIPNPFKRKHPRKKAKE